jgi:hypothetical protein
MSHYDNIIIPDVRPSLARVLQAATQLNSVAETVETGRLPLDEIDDRQMNALLSAQRSLSSALERLAGAANMIDKGIQLAEERLLDAPLTEEEEVVLGADT